MAVAEPLTAELSPAVPDAPRPQPLERLQFAGVALVNLVMKLACVRYETFLAFFERLPPGLLESLGRLRARAAFYAAARRVPAYRRLLAATECDAAVPRETDKENYVRRFAVEQRCVGGRLPDHDVTIDESSGSTGTPYNWVRSGVERHQSHIFISYFTRYCYGPEPLVTLNAFSMGA